MFRTDKLKEKRKERGYTTIELGNLIGVSSSAITNWEKGTRVPRGKSFIKLCEVLSCTADELLGIEHNGERARV